MIMITFAKAGEEDPKAPEVRYIKKRKNLEPLPWLGVKIQLGNHMAPFPLHSHMGSPMLGMWTARQWLSADPPLLLIKISSQHHCHGYYLLLHLLLPTIHWDQLSLQSPQLLCSMASWHIPRSMSNQKHSHSQFSWNADKKVICLGRWPRLKILKWTRLKILITLYLRPTRWLQRRPLHVQSTITLR